MTTKLFIIALILFFSFVAEAKNPVKVEKKNSPVSLTIQAENGSVKQSINSDGSITCTISTNDLIRVSTILLNGEDVTNLLESNKLNLPLLSKNSTLEISFEEIPYFREPEYRTIAMY